MPSKKSFFNRTLFRKNLSRSWPLWGGASLVGSLAPLYIMLSLLSERWNAFPSARDFTEALYQVSTYLVPWVTFLYAIVCAMVVWGYLFSPRHVGMMHTLPVDRTELYITNVLSGLAMMLIPYVIVGTLSCAVAIGCNAFSLLAAVKAALVIILNTLLFFSIATVCAHVTGHLAALPVFYLAANFLVEVANVLIRELTGIFLIGVTSSDNAGLGELAEILTPIIRISSHVEVEWINDSPQITGMGTLLLYGLAGLALLALGWLLYRTRHSERAGDVIAYSWLRPVFRYGVALMSALTAGLGLYMLLWNTLFQYGRYADLIPAIVCFALGGLIGYYIASMLLEKSLRVFKGSLRGAVTVCAGAAVLCCLVSFDIAGLEKWVPERENVESVSFYSMGLSAQADAADDPTILEKIMAIHRAIVDDRAYIRSLPVRESGEDSAFTRFRMEYRLTNGTTISREYNLELHKDRLSEAGTYDALLAALCKDPNVLEQEVKLNKNQILAQIDIYFRDTKVGDDVLDDISYSGEPAQRLYQALLADARAGRMYVNDWLWETMLKDTPVETENAKKDIYYPMSIIIYAPYNRNSLSDNESISLGTGVNRDYTLRSSMTETIDALLELGAVTPEKLALWNELYK